MANKKQVQYFEIGIYILIWTIGILAPFFMTTQTGTRNWNFIFKEWLHLIPFAIIFCVNNFLLVPKFLFKGKYWIYIIACVALVSTVAVLDNRFTPARTPRPNFLDQKEFSHMPGKPDPDKMRFHKNNTPKWPMGPKPPFFTFGITIIYLLIIGFNSGVKIFVRWAEEENAKTEKENQHLITELAFLRNQISPHFFMNTLNNIHSLIDIDTEGAKESIIKLSRLMRYLLYESNVDKTSLKKEIEFLESFIELMRLRYDERNLSIEIEYPSTIDNISIPPFLFLSFVENAFKHGVDTRKKSFIQIRFVVEEKSLIFTIENSIFVKTENKLNENSGIGLENVKKRLQLIYKKDYSLSIHSNKNIYNASLKIPIL